MFEGVFQVCCVPFPRRWHQFNTPSTVRYHLLHHQLRLCHSIRSGRWLGGIPIRVLDSHGFRSSVHGQLLQWLEYQYLDWLGLLCRVLWGCFHLDLHGKPFLSQTIRLRGLTIALQAIYNIIAPGWFVTPVYGNNHFIFESAFYWFSIPITVLLALLPRYLYKALKMGYFPDDIDIIRYMRKFNPGTDLRQESFEDLDYHPLSQLRRQESVASRRTGRESMTSLPAQPRPSGDFRGASRTDMSTGITSQHRGFDFSMEEGGVAIQRMQTNLSERRLSRQSLPRDNTPTKTRLGRKLTLPMSLRRKKDPS